MITTTTASNAIAIGSTDGDGSAEFDNHHHFIEVESPRAGGKHATDAPKYKLEWRKLWLRITTNKASSMVVDEQVIVSNVNGCAHPGELLLITGTSAAESKLLLECIGGRNAAVQGSIAMNGMLWSRKMKRYISYVIEEDLFYESITVHEHLIFQARLRLGKTLTEEQYMLRVDEIIEEVGLTHRRDALIGGGAGRRGILSWERKLLSIATEMLSNPSVLLVEEPTSGLDSLSSEIVVSKLQQIARSGRTVIVTVHHPTSEVFALVDSLYLLSEGAVVYYGKASKANGYFASLGYECPSYSSQIGYYLRLLVIQSRETDHVGAARLAMLKEEWAKREAEIALEAAPFEAGPADDSADVDSAAEARLGFFGQLNVLMTRNVIRLIRYRYWFFWMIIWILLIAVVFGLIFLQLDMTQRGIQNTSGAFFYMILVLLILMAYRTLAHLPMDLAVMSREHHGGWYYVILWFISRSLCAIPREIILPIVFFVPVYLLMGIGHGFSMYFYMQVMLILVSSAAIGLGYLVICLFRRVWLAWLIYAILITLFVIFGGFVINVKDIPDYVVWIHYISPIKYGYEGLMKIYWDRVVSIDCDSSLETCVARTGIEVLTYYGMRSRSALADGFILFGINVVCRFVSVIAVWFRVRCKK
jgi:ABC-type multidrug transport system ATPase subunit